MNIEEKIQQLQEFDKAYFDGAPIIEDQHYDMLKEEIRKESPEHPYFSSVGAPIRGGKIPLPYKMGSLNQIYEGDFERWVSKYNLANEQVIVSEKLDGMSVLLVYKGVDGELKLSTAYSRGNGIEGADITRHLKYMGIPQRLKNIKGDMIAIRAELIMENSVFDAKYAKDNKNPRNMVSGCMNRKTTDSKVLKDINVVAYEIVDSVPDVRKTKVQDFQSLKSFGFEIAHHKILNSSDLDDNKLSNLFEAMQAAGRYELDGIVLTVNEYKTLNNVSKADSLNPEHSVKFKTFSEAHVIDAEVVDVHWKISKNGFFKPRIEVIPVELFGTTVTYATGFNGKFINDNGIGPRAKIKLTKAGAIIPYVVSVEEKVTPKMPDEDWVWDDLGVEIKSVGDTQESVFMQALHFFKTLPVEYLQESSLQKLHNVVSGYMTIHTFEDFVTEVIFLLDHDWKRVLGVNGEKSYTSLHKKLQNIKPEILLGATPFFGIGFGTRKAKKIMQVMTLKEFLSATEEDIKNVEGFDKTAIRVYQGIPVFKRFLAEIEDYVSFVEKTVDVSDDAATLKDHSIVMTGFRDKELQERIEALGGTVSSGVSKKTTILIVADLSSTSAKVKRAKENLNITVLHKDDFLATYIL